MVELSVGIVTYNNEDKIGNLLEDIYQYTKGVDFEVYVVDNLSKDNTVEIVKNHYPNVKIIENSENKGFGYGHNQLLKVIKSQYHLILNPDICFSSNVFRYLLDYLNNHEDTAMVTPRILYPDGNEQFLPKYSPTLRYLVCGRLSRVFKCFESIRAEYTMSDKIIKSPIEIEFCTGCFMLLRTEIFIKCKGFDERFFMYLEDAELTQRVKKYGKVIFNPEVSVIHLWERISSKNLKYFIIHLQSMVKYLRLKRKLGQ